MESRAYEYRGFYVRHCAEGEIFRMYWHFPGKPDVEHVTLGTDNQSEAEFLVESFVRWLGYDTVNQSRDPLISVVVSRFVQSLPEGKRGAAYRSQLKWFRELLDEHHPGIKMSELTTGMQHELIVKMASRWEVNSAKTCMVGVASAVNLACEEDHSGNVFSFARPRIVTSKATICELLDLDDPEVRNWHPDPAGMALVLRELASHEAIRRWAFLALYTALRPTHILEVNSRMVSTQFGQHRLDTRRRRETATDANLKIKGFFSSFASYIKRHPQLPIPDPIYQELMTWGEGPWVNLTYNTVQNHVSRAADKLGMPELVPSSFRDFCKALMQCAFAFFGGKDVPDEQRLVWLGHKPKSQVHEGYGLFHQGFLRDGAEAVVHYMMWLDKESGGALFRHVSAKSVSASYEVPEADIRLSTPSPACPAPDIAQLQEPGAATETLQKNNAVDKAGVGDRVASTGEKLADASGSAERPNGLSIHPPRVHRTDELSDGLRGELARLNGAKLLQRGQIEGFQGVFRRVSDGSEMGIRAGEFQRSGSKHVLPNLACWFRITGIEIYETEVASRDEAVRMFVDQLSQTVIDVSEVKARMVASLGRDPGGWETHSALSEADSGELGGGPFEYRDLNEPHDPPRGLLGLVLPHSPLGAVQGVPRWFKEVFVSERGRLAKGEKLDWRFMLRHLQAFFDLRQIRIYEAEFIISGQLCPLRLFANGLSEKTVSVEYIKQEMLDQLGCDPGGWAEHSSLGKRSTFDVEEFIFTTSMKDELDRLYVDEDDFDPTEGTDIIGWH
ncbi:hypothetical protein GCM10025880_31000 [Methylorubrum aminovorans]|uniref:hypothetical protein n=1 Tax=Methylorubrum aminovorans TaxID=269069 RepID=UPI0023E93E1D|nr:hypothetical protein [Methylorubrum aminovorans]GMA76683.1 hypothetical protein GCM10025880_31000 [Methylorubrum aminovorans]